MPKKGTGGSWVIHQLERDVRRLECSKNIMIPCHNDPAILYPVNKVVHLRKGETLIENALVVDSQPDGRAERTVQTLEKQARVMKLSTEHSLGGKNCEEPSILVAHDACGRRGHQVSDQVRRACCARDNQGSPLPPVSCLSLACPLLSAKVQGEDMEPNGGQEYGWESVSGPINI